MPAGGTSLAAPPPCFSSCRWSPAFCSRWSTAPRPTRPGPASHPQPHHPARLVSARLHGWGSDFMIAIVLIHMVQVFLFGAYKFPRELTWIVGVCLLLLTLGMAFTGQVMRFDQDAYWGLGIGASIMSRVPLIGAPLVHLLLGGPIIGGQTLSRFFTLHVFVIPGLLLAGVGVHIWMVLLHGVSDWPMPGRIVRKSTYEREYHELDRRRPASPSSPTQPGRTLSSPPPSSSPSWPAPSSSAPSAPPARPIPPSSRPRPSPTSPSSGSTRCSLSCRPPSRRPSCWSSPSSPSPPCFCCPSSRARANAIGRAVRSPC